MAYTHDIPFDESNRANRRRSNPDVKSLQKNLIQTKALPKIGDLRFDPNAEDGDGDGLVQDNTPYERPSIIKPSLPRTSGLASLTGSTLFTSSGSWTRGLTNEEIAERAVPDNMADLMNMIQQLRAFTGDENHPYMKKYTDEQLLEATFDPKAIKQMREALVRALDDRPDWRDVVDATGFPPIAVIDDSDMSKPWAGMMHGANLMSIPLSSAKKKGGFFDKRSNNTGQELFAGITGAPYMPDIKQNLVGNGSVDDTLVHEWGHYINYLAMKTHPDSQVRELARYFYLDGWESSPGTSPTRGTRLLAEFFKDKAGGSPFFGMASAPEGEFELPDYEGIPFVKSVYGTSRPVEFFAEATTSYFSPDKKQRALTNDAAKEVVEQIIGRRGLRSQSQTPKRATGSALFGLSPEDIAERVVPRSWEDARELVEEHWYQLATPEQMQLSQDEVRNIIDKAMKDIFENDAGWDNIDFHPDQVATLEAKLVETLYNNPDYYEAVQRLGMPPVFFTSDKAKKVWPKGTLAAAMGDHFPMIAINPEEFERERLKGPRGNKRPFIASVFGGVGINGTKDMVVDPSYESTLVHEWGHYVNKLAAFIHPDEEVRKIGQAYWHMSYGDLTFLEDNDSALFRYADDIMNAQLGGDVLDPEVPFILTHYGQTTPAETFAEGISAMLSGDRRKRDLVSPGLQKDIRKILGLPEEEDTIDVISAERRGLASRSSSARVVKRRSDGTREFRSEWSPINGSDWLKDATLEEIAEAVVPTSEDDAITMMTQILCYGQTPANANEVRAMKAMAKDLLRESFGRTSWDYSPQMRAIQKETLIKAMEESPGFEYLIRMYGLPPIIGVSDGSSAKMRALHGTDVGSFHQPNGRFTMGATLQNMVIGMNYDADAMKLNLPSGFIDMMEMMRLTGKPSSMRSDGVSIATGRTTTMIDNFGLSRMDTLRHEYAHWFWYYHMGSPYTYGQTNSARGQNYGLPDLGKGRSDRALFISKATGETVQKVLDRINGLKWRFDEERITVRSQRNRIQRDLEMLGYVSVDPVTRMASIEAHPDAPTSMGGNGGPQGTSLWQATMGRYIEYANDPRSSDIWSSEDTALFDSQLAAFQDSITGTSEYSKYPIPMIRGVYANATAQETFAEMLNLFLSPDNDLFKRYATDSMLDAIAEGFNLERTPSGIITPWGERNTGPRRGLSSRNANESLLSRTLSTNDRLAVSAKPDADITPSTVTQKAPGVYSFSTGDDKWDFLIGEDMGKQWDTAYASWVSSGGQDRMRQASASLMGIGSMSPADRDESRGSMIDAFVTMSHISTNGEPTPSASYRALALVNSDSEILNAEIGKPLALPLTSFSPDREVHMEIRRQRTGIDDNTKNTGSTVVMRLAPNAQVVKPSKDHDRTFRNDDGDTVTDSREYLTQGQFKITGRQTLSDGTVLVDIEHTHVFDTETGKTKRLRGLASADPNPLASTRDKHIETLDANIKEREDYISSLETALDEWNRLGVWNGGDYGVVVNPNAQPNNITREQMLARNYNPDDFAGQAKERIDTLKTGLDIMKDSRERVKSQPDTTISIESILEDSETLARIQKRAQEVTAMSRAERGELFRDGEYQYVVHWGADTLENGVIDPSRSRGDENTLSTVGNTRRINKVTAMQLVADRDDTKQKLQDLTKLQQEFERTGLVDLSSTDNPFAISSMIGAAVQRGKDRNYKQDKERAYRPWPDAEDLEAMGVTEISPEMQARITEVLEMSRNDQEQKLNRLDKVADKLIADDYQYSSTYPAEKLATANGYGGRYGDEGDSWSNDRPRASRTGIHVFRVRIGDDATKDTGGPDEVHIIGKHTPVASLSIETHRNAGPQPTSAQDTWTGWLAEVVEADKKKRSGGLASRGVKLSREESGIVENAKRKVQADIDAKKVEVDSLESENTRLQQALDELKETGSWQGEKYDIRISQQGEIPPATYTRQELVGDLEEGESFDSYIATYLNSGSRAIADRQVRINEAKKELAKLEDTKKIIGRDKPNTTFDIEELLANDELAELLRKRTQELDTMTPGARRRMWTNPENGETYAIHWGAVDLAGGAIDPSRSRGDENSGVFVENTRKINRDAAEPWVKETANLRRRLEEEKLSATDDKTKADIERREIELQKREKIAEQLVADNYQHSSANDVGSLMISDGYGGRYADEGADIGGTTTWGERVEKSPRMGIHILRIDESNSTSFGGGEVHLVGKHTPIATLVAPRENNTNLSGGPRLSDIYGGWVDMAVQQDIQSRTGIPPQQRTGMASRASKASAKRITKNFKVNGKPRPKPENRQEFVTRSVPRSASDLMRIIEESPYMKGKKSSEEIFDLINLMEIDWPAQEKLALKLEKVLADSPGFEELLGEYDIPMMLITKNGAAKSALGYTDTLYQNRERWNFIEGEYMPQHGFIAFPARVVNQETVHNAVSDGPLPTDDIIRHELSHTIHAMAMAKSRKARKAYEKDTAEFVAGISDAIDMAERTGDEYFRPSSYSPLSPEEHALAGEVSRYAQTKRSEYIAELLTHMLPGKKTKFVLPKDEHYAMLSEFLDIPVARLRELANKSFDARTGWL